MERLNALAPRQLLLGAGALLLIDTFLAWQKVEVKISDVGSIEATANAWHGFFGVIMCLAVIVLLVLVAAKTFGVAIPPVIPFGLTTLGLGVLILAFAVLKNLVDDYSAWASYVGIVLAALVALGAWRVFDETGEALPAGMGPTEERPIPTATTATPVDDGH